jgi:hypothetical protein
MRAMRTAGRDAGGRCVRKVLATVTQAAQLLSGVKAAPATECAPARASFRPQGPVAGKKDVAIAIVNRERLAGQPLRRID